jgi:hypothetical protein
MATYTKLRDGTWGLRGAGLTAGRAVTVRKKSGETRQETVGRVLWTGPDGTCLATMVSSSAPAPQRHSDGRRNGGRRECDECGDYVTPGTRCWETGLLH